MNPCVRRRGIRDAPTRHTHTYAPTVNTHADFNACRELIVGSRNTSEAFAVSDIFCHSNGWSSAGDPLDVPAPPKNCRPNATEAAWPCRPSLPAVRFRRHPRRGWASGILHQDHCPVPYCSIWEVKSRDPSKWLTSFLACFKSRSMPFLFSHMPGILLERSALRFELCVYYHPASHWHFQPAQSSPGLAPHEPTFVECLVSSTFCDILCVV